MVSWFIFTPLHMFESEVHIDQKPGTRSYLSSIKTKLVKKLRPHLVILYIYDFPMFVDSIISPLISRCFTDSLVKPGVHTEVSPV